MQHAGASRSWASLWAVGACERHDVHSCPCRPAARAAGRGPGARGGRRSGLRRPEACAECHAERVEAVRKTSHFNTSAPVSTIRMRAPLPGKVAGAAGLTLEVGAPGDELWQLAIDISATSGSRGAGRRDRSAKVAQTFLSWQKDRLTSCRRRVFAQVGWRFSPGYWRTVDFRAPRARQCLECHASGRRPATRSSCATTPSSARSLLGRDLRECHGPGVRTSSGRGCTRTRPRREDPRASTCRARAADDICLLCHSTRGEDKQPVFTYRPGDDLRAHYGAPAAGVADVPLRSTRSTRGTACTQPLLPGSGTMSCITCHNLIASNAATRQLLRALPRCHDVTSFPRRGAAHSGKSSCLGLPLPRRAPRQMPLRTSRPHARPPHRCLSGDGVAN